MSLWNNIYWGVLFRCPGTGPFLVGETWHKVRPPAYDGEPLRPLLFNTRKQARAWCAAEMTRYASAPQTYLNWRVRAVRVRLVLKPA